MVLYKLVSNLSAMQISMTLFHIYLCLINHHLPVMAYFQPSLNEAQERAFRIVANHAVESNGEQLKMYLGGMAGTSKSRATVGPGLLLD